MKKEIKFPYKKGKCIIEDCPIKDKIYCRGLCICHYTLMRRTVQKGNHTWEEFEDYGMLLPERGNLDFGLFGRPGEKPAEGL